MINILVSHLPRLGELPVRAKDNRELDVEGCNGGRRVVLWIETAHREPDKCYDESVCLARGQVLGTAIVWKLVARGNRHTIAYHRRQPVPVVICGTKFAAIAASIINRN